MERALGSRRFLGTLSVVVLVTGVVGTWIGLRLGGAAGDTLGRRRRHPARGADRVGALLARPRTTSRADAAVLDAARLRDGMLDARRADLGLLRADHRTCSAHPSWADVGYLSAIPFAVAALVVHPATHGKRHAQGALGVRRPGRRHRAAVPQLDARPRPAVAQRRPQHLGGHRHAWPIPFGDVVIVFFIVLAIRGMTGGTACRCGACSQPCW